MVAHPTNQQHFFNLPNYHYSLVRKYFWDAPLFKRRHHREFQLSKAVNMGTLPSRSQTIFLLCYLVMATTLTVYDLPWSGPMETVLTDVIQRTGYMAIMNMLPLFLLAARNNPLITWTGIPFDTYNLVHRWLGRVVVLESLIHAGSWIIREVKYSGGWAAVNKSVTHTTFIMSGFIVSMIHSSGCVSNCVTIIVSYF
jgi:predicted ferric reductase